MPLIDVCQQCDMLEVFDNPVLGEGDNRAMGEKLLQTHQKKLKSNLKLNHKKLTILDKMANGLVNLASAYIADVTSNSLYLTKHQSTDKLEYQSDSPLPTRRHRANSQRKVFFADEMGHALVSVLFVEKTPAVRVPGEPVALFRDLSRGCVAGHWEDESLIFFLSNDTERLR